MKQENQNLLTKWIKQFLYVIFCKQLKIRNNIWTYKLHWEISLDKCLNIAPAVFVETYSSTFVPGTTVCLHLQTASVFTHVCLWVFMKGDKREEGWDKEEYTRNILTF